MWNWLREVFTTDLVKFGYGFAFIIFVVFIIGLIKVSGWFKK